MSLRFHRKLEAAEKRVVELEAEIAAMKGKATTAAKAAPKSLSEQLAAIADPVARNRFYKANKAALKAESRKA